MAVVTADCDNLQSDVKFENCGGGELDFSAALNSFVLIPELTHI